MLLYSFFPGIDKEFVIIYGLHNELRVIRELPLIPVNFWCRLRPFMVCVLTFQFVANKYSLDFCWTLISLFCFHLDICLLIDD